MDETTGEIKEFKDQEELDKAIRSGNWVELKRKPKKHCRHCHGRGHIGFNTSLGKYVPCRCCKKGR